MPDHDFDIPEMNRIGELLREISGSPGTAATPPVKSAKKNTAAPARFRIGAIALGSFAEGVNWQNELTHQSPWAAAKSSGGPRLGALKVSAFAAGTNWSNSIGAAPLFSAPAETTPVSPPTTLDNFMSDFAWD